MITEDLITYILAQTRKNIPTDTIALRLENAGWHTDDIKEAFDKINPPQPAIKIPVYSPINPNPISVAQPASEEKIEPQIQAVPIKPVFATGFKEAHVGVETLATGYYIPDNFSGSREPKPIVNEPIKAPSDYSQSKIEAKEFIPKLVEKPIAPAPQAVVIEQPAAAVIAAAPVISVASIVNPIVNPVINPVVDPILTPVITPVVIPTPAPQPVSPIITEEKKPFIPVYTEAQPLPVSQSNPSSFAPASAMLYSYPQEVSQANKLNHQIHSKSKRKILRWTIVIVLVSFLAGAGFAIAAKYIKLPSFNLSLVKKDPRTILASAVPLPADSLKYYKINTNATISLPSFANISSGLATGDKITSTDTDFLSISAKGLVDNSSAPTVLFDYDAVISSSLFKKDITTDLKYNNGMAFLTTPDLRQLIGQDAPPVGTVLIQDGQFEPLFQLLPSDMQNLADKIDMHKMLSIGLPSYINGDIASVFKDFINSASVIEKSPEVISGVDTYHYELSADSISTKTFLTRFGNLFLGDMSDSDSQDINQALGAVSIDSLEVWVGKKDNMIYQYKFSATVPLSKVIGLDDKGIAGKSVQLDWKTTYSDFNVPNSIILPTNAISIASFMSIVNDSKIKNLITSFNTSARILHNAIGSYGKRANATGSCTNPNPSSLFSPVGHTSGASMAVGTIAGSINDMLNLTNGALACYSTPSAWAIAAPLQSKPSQFICSDSTGQTTMLSANINGPVCK